MIPTLLAQVNFSQKSRLARLALIACFGSALSVSMANADTIQIFDASGTFVDGASLSGTVTIDTTNGIVTASTLAVSAPDTLAFDFVQFQQSNVSGIWELTFGTTAAGLPNLNIGIATTGSADPLIGYTGGSVASINSPVMGGVSDIFYSSATQVSLTSGSFTLPTATPEPTTLALLILGGAPLAFFGARRRRSQLAK
jgi:hypothetical protein